MTANRTLSNLAVAMMGLPVILGISLCYLRAERTGLWVAAMLFLPVSWLGIKAVPKALRTTMLGTILMPLENTADARKAISSAMIFASLIAAMPMGAKLANALGLIDESLAAAIAARWMSVLAGGYLILRGNRLPKILTPLPDIRCDPATMQSLQRRTGWAYVLAGFTFTLVWLVLPVHLAQPIGMGIIAVGILVPTFILRFYAKRWTALLNH
jgi:hypothetical protein